jgi:hypothetical protein
VNDTIEYTEDGYLALPLEGIYMTPEKTQLMREFFRAEEKRALEDDERITAWHRVASHPFFATAFKSQGTLIDAMIAKLNDLMPKPWLDAKPGEIWDLTTKDGGEKTLRYATQLQRDNSESRSSVYFEPVDSLYAPKLGLRATVITAGTRIYPKEEA